jgi:hypothetical protein
MPGVRSSRLARPEEFAQASISHLLSASNVANQIVMKGSDGSEIPGSKSSSRSATLQVQKKESARMARTFEIDTDGGWTMVARIIHRLIVSLTFAAMTLAAGQIFAQGASPAQPPGQTVAPASDASPSPSANGATPSNAACMKGLVALGKEVVERDRPFKAAGDGHAPPNEVCKLIGKFGQSEIKMIEYIDANSAECGTPPRIGARLKAQHRNTEAMQTKVCMEPAWPVGDFDDIGAPPLIR